MPNHSFFQNQGPFPITELASISSCRLEGNDQLSINDVATIADATPNTITFLSNKKYASELASSNASACIISEEFIKSAPTSMTLLIAKDPYAAYAAIAHHFYPSHASSLGPSQTETIHPSATIGNNCYIAPTAVIGANAVIGDHATIDAGAVIGQYVKIGNNANIGANTTISHSIIGDDFRCYPGVSIGQDGFGFATVNGKHVKVPQLGGVTIGNDVEIGANCSIDRGANNDTIISDGCRLDNLIQIGHNVRLGRGCVVVSHVGIAGSATLGNYVVVGGQVGIAGHLTIGDMVTIAAQSGVAQNIESGQTVGGSPALPIAQWRRQAMALKRLVKPKKNKTS